MKPPSKPKYVPPRFEPSEPVPSEETPFEALTKRVEFLERHLAMVERIGRETRKAVKDAQKQLGLEETKV